MYHYENVAKIPWACLWDAVVQMECALHPVAGEAIMEFFSMHTCSCIGDGMLDRIEPLICQHLLCKALLGFSNSLRKLRVNNTFCPSSPLAPTMVGRNCASFFLQSEEEKRAASSNKVDWVMELPLLSGAGSTSPTPHCHPMYYWTLGLLKQQFPIWHGRTF